MLAGRPIYIFRLHFPQFIATGGAFLKFETGVCLTRD